MKDKPPPGFVEEQARRWFWAIDEDPSASDRFGEIKGAFEALGGFGPGIFGTPMWLLMGPPKQGLIDEQANEMPNAFHPNYA